MTTSTNGTVTTLPTITLDEFDQPAADMGVQAAEVTEPADVQEQARQAYRDSVAADQPLSGKALGEMFERGERWGRDRIAEAKKGTGNTVTARPATARKPKAPTVKATAVPSVKTEAAAPVAERKPAPRTPDVAAPAPVVTPSGGRLVSWVGFVFGSIMSVAANVLHTWLPAATMPEGWTPGIASQIGAAVWPIGLLLSVEVLSRVAWQSGFWWNLARYGGAGTVALGSAVISYGHLRDLLAAWGYGVLAAHVGPLVLDGLMVISGFALLAMSMRTKGAAA
ncbi:Protein of unknown function [Lentzea albidocapillata subsp. violacea]|uniref:Uncharacterized protein n=1 Tax=Lentzea albidocapillata subsp. violacea TaxID=128104 RepID=A0A1G9X2Z9_9PSEU|nr:DUF2637 domain-containing protein [Lentzea albidocapillata]SDM91098.1 Protein of unknown function [Lentzea albidocapillata subsp. violacea]